MVRVPVPEDYDRGVVTVAGTHDHLYGEADVNLDGVRHARHLKVNEATEGSIGVPEHYADAVADFLGVERPSTMSEPIVEGTSTTEGDVVEVSATIEAGECPWCDDYDGEHVGQHASSAHAEEWRAYKATVDD